MKSVLVWILSLSLLSNLDANMKHHRMYADEWAEEMVTPFTEMMVSWNAERPQEGRYLIYISVKIEKWSPWLLYADWGSQGQSSFSAKADGFPVKVYQDAVESSEKASGFRIRIEPQGDAALSLIHSIHVYTNGDLAPASAPSALEPIVLPVNGLSQMALPHIRCTDLCSPTSTTAVVRYLSQRDVDPIEFAEHVRDSGFDIFGNWVFNVAQAAAVLGKDWDCWVERLHGIDDICQHLRENTPVIVSVRGPLPGSARPYASGHLIAVIGFDPIHQQVLCMDPAFPADNETHVSYDLTRFLEAWNRRGRVAYVFSKP